MRGIEVSFGFPSSKRATPQTMAVECFCQNEFKAMGSHPASHAYKICQTANGRPG